MEPRDVEPRELRSLAGVMGDGGFFPLFPLISCRGAARPACLPGVSRAGVPLALDRPPPAPVVRTGRADGCAPLPSGITASGYRSPSPPHPLAFDSHALSKLSNLAGRAMTTESVSWLALVRKRKQLVPLMVN